jgi:hypothetical protein
VLTSEERTQVTNAFADALIASDKPRQLVREVFPDKAAYSLILEGDGTDNPRALSVITLDVCLRDRWTRTPAMLETLLHDLVHVRSIDVGTLAPILTRVRQRIDPNQSVYDATWLLGNTRPFFDRHDLRQKVRLLIEGSGKSILLVPHDPDGYGRSYTLDFLAHVAGGHPDDVEVLAAVVSEGGGPSYTVNDLLREISVQLAYTEPLPDRTRSSHADSAILWLLGPLMKSGPRWVLVFDGFGQGGVAPEVLETIQRLSSLVATVPRYRNRIRLVLLDHPPDWSGMRRADVLAEKLPPAAGICQGDLLPCLEAWDALRQTQGMAGIPASELGKLADNLLARAPASGKGRLAALHNDFLMLLDMPEGGPDGAF